MLFDLPLEILTQELLPILHPSSLFNLVFSHRAFETWLFDKTTVGSLIRLFSSASLDQDDIHRWLVYWAYLSFRPTILASLLAKMDSKTQRNTIEECYALMMLNGQYDAGEILRTIYRNEDDCFSPYKIHRGAFRYMRTLKDRPQIYDMQMSPMNQRLGLMIGLFMNNDNSMRALSYFLVADLSTDQLEQILQFSSRFKIGCYSAVTGLRRYMIKQMVSKLRRSLCVKISSSNDKRSIPKKILGYLLINSNYDECILR